MTSLQVSAAIENQAPDAFLVGLDLELYSTTEIHCIKYDEDTAVV